MFVLSPSVTVMSLPCHYRVTLSVSLSYYSRGSVMSHWMCHCRVTLIVPLSLPASTLMILPIP